MNNPKTEVLNFTKEFQEFLNEYEESELLKFIDYTRWFGEIYTSSCELEGPIYLVLDNSVIQSFKHKKSQPKREIQALAYTAFCRFVKGWSNRKVQLAVTPGAVFEHMGRRAVLSVEDAYSALLELKEILHTTKLPISGLGFKNADDLYTRLNNVKTDEEFLTKFVRELDDSDWKVDLQSPDGVIIPISIAQEAIPDKLPLKYFDPWFVKFVLSGRIEQHIIKQSQHNPQAMPISSGELTNALSRLNTFKKNSSILKGLGDIDILQYCDLSSQFQQNSDYILLGQTFDRGLSEVLRRRTSFVVGSGVTFGTPDQDEQIEKMISLMTSNPFKDNEVRGEQARLEFNGFFSSVIDVCKKINHSN
jgi:hypothetical protein